MSILRVFLASGDTVILFLFILHSFRLPTIYMFMLNKLIFFFWFIYKTSLTTCHISGASPNDLVLIPDEEFLSDLKQKSTDKSNCFLRVILPLFMLNGLIITQFKTNLYPILM